LSAPDARPSDKRAVLRALIRGATDFKNAIIFSNRKRDVATLERSLSKHGFNAGALHGDMDQRSRTQTLDDFRKGKLTLLVASDVAARGLDIPAVSHIFNFDVPTHSEDYIHRIGRTGRAGLKGTAITIATSLDRKYVAGIEKMIGMPIPPMEVEAGAERAAAFHKPRGEHEETQPASGDDRAPRRGRGEARNRHGRSNREPRAEQTAHAPAPRQETPAEPIAVVEAAAPCGPAATSRGGSAPAAPARPQPRSSPPRAARQPERAAP
jgi:superfamily II DNA/RNA helicase